MYYNTNNESGETLVKSKATTVSQEDKIYEYFKTSLIPVAPHCLMGLFENTPITSVRRAVTNLEKRGKLVKTERMVMGSYGKIVHTWRLNERQLELQL